MKSDMPGYQMIMHASHPARGAWIEIKKLCFLRRENGVAPRKGCVD